MHMDDESILSCIICPSPILATSIVSAVLWMADALFYLRGDFVVLYRKQNSKSDETSKC